MKDEEKTGSENTGEQPETSEVEAVQKTNDASEEKISAGSSRLQRLKGWYLNKKKFSIPLTIILVLVILAAVPWTRYKLASLAVSQNMTVQVNDASANTPVSGADVTIGGVSAQTDATGKAQLKHVKAGSKNMVITKKYYKDTSVSLLVPILKPKSNINVELTATGRQVKIVIKNLISKQPLSNVQINAADTISKTDQSGTATLVLPAGVASVKATLNADGYNDSSVVIQISNQSIKENDFSLTPAGRIYFLSNRTGKLSVMKSNVDGSDAQTVLEGTGYEDPNGTYLEVSPDQKYVALIAKRASSDPGPQFYIISTADDKLLGVDTGNATFAPVGWYNDYFVYTVSRQYLQNWQPNAFSIKSYNAQNGQIISLVSTTATGTSNADAQYENIWQEFLLGNNVVYSKVWYQYPGYINVSGKQNVLAAIHPDGTGAKTLKSMDSAISYVSNMRLNNPSQLYFSIYDSSASSSSYYQLDKSGNVSSNNSIADNFFYGHQTNYYISPSRQASLWDANRDGKTDVVVADQDGNNDKTVARLDPAFHVYGWYTDNYLLVSKSDSELYIMSKSGVNSQSDLIKITDYQSTGIGGY